MMNTDRLPEVNNLPNDETIAAMKEVDEMRKHPEQYPSFILSMRCLKHS